MMAVKRREDAVPGEERVAKKAFVKGKAKEKGGKGKAFEKTPAFDMKKGKDSEKIARQFAPDAGQGDEPDFPRGGASALTPAEIRGARLEAESEFQEEIQKKPRGGKNVQQRSRAGSGTKAVEDPLFSFGLNGKLPNSSEILRYKSLSLGMKIWGAVTEVNPMDLVVSLPGGLRGFVNVAEASDVSASSLNQRNPIKVSSKRLKGKGQGDALVNPERIALREDEEDLSADKSGGISLKEIFSVGQLVACTVTSLEQREAKGGKQKDNKRIGLSLRLSVLHEGLTIDAIFEGMPITAYVSSVEDHGYLLLFGVPGISGFLQYKNYEEKSRLKAGQILQGEVLSVDKKRSTVSVKAGKNVMAGSMIKDHEGLTMNLLTPGMSVNARVRAILRNGLLLSFLSYFSGTVDLFHLDVALLGSKWKERFEENQRLKAKILYVDTISKVIGLTLNGDLLRHSVPAFTVKTGDIFDNAIVRRVDPTIGLLLELPSKSTATAGYAHISNASDDHIEKLEKKFTEGKKVRARVTGFRMMDGLATVSLKKTVLEQLLISHADIKPAMVVHATITAVESFGAIVQLGDGLKGLCPLQHMSEYQRVAPSPKFKVGARLKFRVLSCDPETRKIILTHKKTLVASKLTPITSYDDAVEGLVTHGWITGIADYGCFVNFYNDVNGLAHRTELGVPTGTKIDSVFQLGQCIKCRILRANSLLQRLAISFVTVSGRDDDDKNVELEIKPGSIVSGTIVLMRENSILLDVQSKNGVMKGVLAYTHLSDNPVHNEQGKSLLTPGYAFERLLVLETLRQKLTLSAKFSLLQAAATLPSNISELENKAVYQGFIANITESGCFVRFLSRLTGLASIPHVADAFVASASQFFTVGQSVRAQVLEVKEDIGKFYVSLKQSACFSTDSALIQGYFIEEEKLYDLSKKLASSAKVDWSEELTIGNFVEGEIQDVKDYGVIVNLYKHKDVVGFLTHYQVGELVEIGKKVKARVLDVVKADGIVDLTLRPELFSMDNTVTATGKKGISKKRNIVDAQETNLNTEVTTLVELVKDEYLVLSLPEHNNAIGFASTRDYNMRALDPHKLYQPGQRLTATLQALPDASTGGRLLLVLSNSNQDAGVPARKRSRKNFKCNPGSLIEAEIISVDSMSISLAVGRNFTGSIHITEVWDGPQEGHPFDDYKVGQTLTAKVLTKVRAPRSPGFFTVFHMELSIRPSELTGSELEKKSNVRPSFDTVEVGQIVTAYVQDIDAERAWLHIGPHLRGRLFVLDSSNIPSELLNFKDRYTVGQAIRCRVSRKDLRRGNLDLSLRNVDNYLMDEHVEHLTAEIQPGMILGGRVARVYPGIGGLSIQIGGNTFGRVHVCHLSDVWEDNPSKSFQEGQFVRTFVLEVGTTSDGKPQTDLSLKKSLCGSGGETSNTKQNLRVDRGTAIETLEDVYEGLQTQGYVKSVTTKGCFVTLSRSVDARIVPSELSDSFVADPSQSFPPGKLVKGRITSVEPVSGHVEMSLKSESLASKSFNEKNNLNQLEDIHVGDLVNGQIRRIESFGVFIAIENSSIVGMCHVSELSDSYVKNINQQYNVGQKVKAMVLKVDPDSKRVSLGLKESYTKSSSGMETNVDSDSEAPSDEEMLVEESAEGPEDNIQMIAVGKGGKYVDDDDDDDLHVLTEKKEYSTTFEAIPALQVDLGLSDSDPDVNEDVEGSENDSKMEDVKASTKAQQRSKKSLKRKREAEVRAAEEKRLQENQAPETVDEFEQLVRTSPNSSFVWIKYMAFMLSLADVDKAREIANRALQTISFREEGEKLNVWVAYLNLENAYGNPKKEAVLNVFQKALQYCDPKKVYLALLGIYEKTEQHDLSSELLKTITRKFKTSAKVWLRNIQNLLTRGMEEEAQKGLEQSLLSLPQRKHVKVISQVAIMEFKIGSPERARTIFEGVVRNYPRRTDLWSVYLDQEIRLGDQTVIRALFERAVALELPPKKIKFLFKKYLDFEKSSGDDQRAEYVKTKAMEYVEAKLG